MAFHDIQFPNDISYGSSGGPTYATDVVMTASGHEQRNASWAQARTRYNVAHGVKTQGQLDTLIAFFRARQGRAHGFRFKDWTDYTAVSQTLGVGDGSTNVFALIKTYSSGSASETRRITKPVDGSVAMYFDSVLQSAGYSVDYVSGVVTFDAAPGSGVVIHADFEFDVPVRFDTDHLSARLDTYGVRSWNDIPLVEVRV